MSVRVFVLTVALTLFVTAANPCPLAGAYDPNCESNVVVCPVNQDYKFLDPDTCEFLDSNLLYANNLELRLCN